MISGGNIILVPKGTKVLKQDGSDYKLRKDLIRVVDSVGGGEVVWEQPGGYDWRYASVEAVRVLNEGDHRLSVGRRQVRGGGWGGWTASYMTSGKCRCGAEFNKQADAREVREFHREHVLGIAEDKLDSERASR